MMIRRRTLVREEVLNLQAPHRTPSYWDLFDAIGEGDVDWVKMILEESQAPKNLLLKKDLQGLTPLKKAIALSQGEIARILVSYGAQPGIADPVGRTPLHIAAILGKRELLAPLLVSEDSDVNAQDKYERTPLHYAVRGKHEKAVDWLLFAGADANVKDSEDHTPIDLCEPDSPFRAQLVKKGSYAVQNNTELCSAYIGQKKMNRIGPDGCLMFVTSAMWSSEVQFLLCVRVRPHQASPPIPLRKDEMFMGDVCHYRMMRRLKPTFTRVKAYFLLFEALITSEVIMKVTSKTRLLGEVPVIISTYNQENFTCYLASAELDLKDEGQFALVKRTIPLILTRGQDGAMGTFAHPNFKFDLPDGSIPNPPPDWDSKRQERAVAEYEQMMAKLKTAEDESDHEGDKTPGANENQNARLPRDQNASARSLSGSDVKTSLRKETQRAKQFNKNRSASAAETEPASEIHETGDESGSDEEGEEEEEEDPLMAPGPDGLRPGDMLEGDEPDLCEDFYFISHGWALWLEYKKTVDFNILMDKALQERNPILCSTDFYKIHHTSNKIPTKKCLVQIPKTGEFVKTGTVLVLVRSESDPDEEEFPDPDEEADEHFLSKDGKNTWGNFWLQKERDKWNLLDFGIVNKKTRVVFNTKKLGIFVVVQLKTGTQKWEREEGDSSSEEEEEKPPSVAAPEVPEGEAEPEGEEGSSQKDRGSISSSYKEKKKKRKKSHMTPLEMEPEDEDEEDAYFLQADSETVLAQLDEGGEGEGGAEEGEHPEGEAEEGQPAEGEAGEQEQEGEAKPEEAGGEAQNETASNVYGDNISNNNNKNAAEQDERPRPRGATNVNTRGATNMNNNASFLYHQDDEFDEDLLPQEMKTVVKGLDPLPSSFASLYGEIVKPKRAVTPPSEEQQPSEAEKEESTAEPHMEEGGEEEDEGEMVEIEEVESDENLPFPRQRALSIMKIEGGKRIVENFKYGPKLTQMPIPEADLQIITTAVALKWRYRNHRTCIFAIFTRPRDKGYDLIIEVVKLMDLYIRAEQWWSQGYKMIAQTQPFPLKSGRLFSLDMEGTINVEEPPGSLPGEIQTRWLYCYISKLNFVQYFVKRAVGKDDDPKGQKKGPKKKDDKADNEPDAMLEITGYPKGTRTNGMDIALVTVNLAGPDLWYERHVELRSPDNALLTRLVNCLKKERYLVRRWWKAVLLLGYAEKEVEAEKGKTKMSTIIKTFVNRWFEDNLNAPDRGILSLIAVLKDMELEGTIQKVVGLLKQYKVELLQVRLRPRYLKLLFHWIIQTKMTRNNLIKMIDPPILRPVSDIFLLKLSDLLDSSQLYKIGGLMDVEDNVLHAIAGEEVIRDQEYLPFRVLVKSRQKKDEIIHYTLLLLEMAKQCEQDEAREFVETETRKWMETVATTEPEICAKLENVFG